MAEFRVSDESRVLAYDEPDGTKVHVYPTSETGQLSSGTRRVSKTWNFDLGGLRYRVQLQVTDLQGRQSDAEVRRGR